MKEKEAQMRKEHIKFLEEVGRCELCGSKRNLQLHHMIPMVCENEYIDLDVEDNWLCVCSACHARLTPKNLLTRYGISKAKVEIHKKEQKDKFYKMVDAEINDGYIPRPHDILDMYEKAYCEE